MKAFISPVLITLIFLNVINCRKDETIAKKDPLISWAAPATIAQGTLLSELQLNATADVNGSFEYIPSHNTALPEGTNQILKVKFTPSDLSTYNSVSKTVTINVTHGSASTFNATLAYDTVSDSDHNLYKTIQIGTQTWMAENLRTTKYRNGDVIPEVTINASWKDLTSGAYCNYENTTDLDKIATQGRLYNWFAVSDVRNLAPKGWHVATDAEWTTLATFLGGATIAGGKVKETGTTHWNTPNAGATNSSGFTALPSGRREYSDGTFLNMGYNGFWWTSSPYNPDYSWYRQMRYDVATIEPANFHKQYGFAVRCVKD
jgi:uncharacterized protein (TIGR02145 family)